MKISSTRLQATKVTPRATETAEKPKEIKDSVDSWSLATVKHLAADPVPKSGKWGVIIPTAGGLAAGAAAGLLGEGLGAGASLPGMAILGVAGAALGSKIDNGKGSKWTKILGGTGVAIGAAGVVAGALGGVPGAIAGGVSMAGTGFAMGHLFSHLDN